jgi:hypothetical protein
MGQCKSTASFPPSRSHAVVVKVRGLQTRTPTEMSVSVGLGFVLEIPHSPEPRDVEWTRLTRPSPLTSLPETSAIMRKLRTCDTDTYASFLCAFPIQTQRLLHDLIVGERARPEHARELFACALGNRYVPRSSNSPPPSSPIEQLVDDARACDLQDIVENAIGGKYDESRKKCQLGERACFRTLGGGR